MTDTPTSVYCITQRDTGKMYVGITNGPVKKRWKTHVWHATHKDSQAALHRAIRKYGEAAFEVECLHVYGNRSEAMDAEIELISNLELHAKGYNVGAGGEGNSVRVRGPLSAETKAKISAARKGRPLSEEHKLALSKAHTGTSWSAAQRASIPPALKAAYETSDAMKRGLSLGLKARWGKL